MAWEENPRDIINAMFNSLQGHLGPEELLFEGCTVDSRPCKFIKYYDIDVYPCGHSRIPSNTYSRTKRVEPRNYHPSVVRINPPGVETWCRMCHKRKRTERKRKKCQLQF